MSNQPKLVMICGPNGAGKSTLTERVRQKYLDILILIDPDKIAKDQNVSSIEAGRITSTLIKDSIAKKHSFFRESTLSSNSDFLMLRDAKANGFEVHLTYVGIFDVETTIKRVKRRHQKGGHDVPEDDIRRRYTRSLENLPKAIKLADRAEIIDNSFKNYQTIAKFEKGKLISHTSPPQWFQKLLEPFVIEKRIQNISNLDAHNTIDGIFKKYAQNAIEKTGNDQSKVDWIALRSILLKA